MKLTKAIAQYCQREMIRLCDHMHIAKGDIPDLTLDIISNKHRLSSTNMSGVFYQQTGRVSKVSDLLYINVAALPNRKALRYTIAHELVHLKYRHLQHGAKFDAYVEDLI